MPDDVKSLSPVPLWSHFAALCAIPRPSKHEAAAAAYVERVARARGLAVTRDDVGNVIVKKPATKGMEGRRTVVLQSHLDMVPQKADDVVHDFTRDPIKAHVDGAVVRAERTTLGADDGIGVSAALAVLESTDVAHGPLEALFTVDEETGMTGANGLAPGLLEGDILVNLDSEDEGEICIGCAGGADFHASMKTTETPVAKGAVALTVAVVGLKGGHSGVDIHLGRANANKVLARLLYEAMRAVPVRLARFAGGNLRNAIPRSAQATVVVAAKDVDRFEDAIAKVGKTVRAELAAVDPELQVTVERAAKKPTKAVTPALSLKIVRTLVASPHGVFAMVRDMPSVTETSTNLAIVELGKGKLAVTHMLRSSVDSKRQDVANTLSSLFELLGCDVEVTGEYPGWTPNTASPVLALLDETYAARFGKRPKITATHGGLECGIIRSKYPSMDAVSIGPTVRFPHSPDEQVDVASVQKFWDFLVDALGKIPAR